MNTNSSIASIAILLASLFSSAAFAQTGTLSFTGSIVAPACTGTLQHTSIHNLRNNTSLNPTINQCSLSDATLTRTHISSQANQNNFNSKPSSIVTVSYE